VLTKEAGIPITEAARLLTVNPARVMGLDSKGDLTLGKDADIVIFDSDINVKQVFVNGEQQV
jgi:N-acetylglucosamine-6-phosphate deacetylase